MHSGSVAQELYLIFISDLSLDTWHDAVMQRTGPPGEQLRLPTVANHRKSGNGHVTVGFGKLGSALNVSAAAFLRQRRR